jgi:hypothetical protein
MPSALACDEIGAVDASQQAAREAAFYEGALGRVRNMIFVLTLPLTAAAWGFFGGMAALGFLLGCAGGYLNFHWLKRGVALVVERMVSREPSAPGRGGVVAGFLLRYAVLAAGAYAIFSVSSDGLYGFLAGLFLPVAAMMCEAVYEGWVAIRQGS